MSSRVILNHAKLKTLLKYLDLSSHMKKKSDFLEYKYPQVKVPNHLKTRFTYCYFSRMFELYCAVMYVQSWILHGCFRIRLLKRENSSVLTLNFIMWMYAQDFVTSQLVYAASTNYDLEI